MRGPKTSIILLAAVAAIAGGMSAPADADARQTIKKSIWGPTQFGGQSLFPTYKDLGVGIYQQLIHWDDVAKRRPRRPNNPRDRAYRWPAHIAYAVREARRHRMRVSLAIMGTPRWANGGRNWNWAPRRTRDFANFITAATRKYPRVNHWMIWIEPSRRHNFRPLARERRGKRLTVRQRRGPRRYAQLLDAAYVRLKMHSRRNKVIGGNSFTTGDVSARNWVRYMRLPSGRRARMDLWGHNPFGYRKPALRQRPLGYGFADFGTLDTMARWLNRWQRRGLRFFLSEYTVPTSQNHEFNFWVSERTQAEYARAALRIVRRWKRIYTMGWFQLMDEAPRSDGLENKRGLMTYQGQRKPSYRAFKRG